MTYADLADFYKIDLAELDWPKRGTSGDARFRLSGLRHFLIAYYEHQQLIMFGRFPEEWELIWRANAFAHREALEQWHRRLPRRLSATDRARVAEILSRTPLNTPRANQARRWAAKRSP